MAEYYQTRVAAIVAEESDSGKAQSATLLGETLTPMASKVLSTLAVTSDATAPGIVMCGPCSTAP